MMPFAVDVANLRISITKPEGDVFFVVMATPFFFDVKRQLWLDLAVTVQCVHHRVVVQHRKCPLA